MSITPGGRNRPEQRTPETSNSTGQPAPHRAATAQSSHRTDQPPHRTAASQASHPQAGTSAKTAGPEQRTSAKTGDPEQTTPTRRNPTITSSHPARLMARPRTRSAREPAALGTSACVDNKVRSHLIRPLGPRRRKSSAAGATSSSSPHHRPRDRKGEQLQACRQPQGVELWGFEPQTSSMPWRRATNCAIAPGHRFGSTRCGAPRAYSHPPSFA